MEPTTEELVEQMINSDCSYVRLHADDFRGEARRIIEERMKKQEQPQKKEISKLAQAAIIMGLLFVSVVLILSNFHNVWHYHKGY